MNIYDISREAGVSIATVSRVLNGSDRVSPATREKVLRVIDKYHYTPNAFARGLGLNTMRTIGILYADATDIYLANAVSCLDRELWKHSYACLLCCSGYQLEEKREHVRFLLSRNIDALILTGSQFVEERPEDNAYLKEAAAKVPVFLLNGAVEGVGLYSVLCDDRDAVRGVTDGMLRTGSGSPIFLYRAMSYSGMQKRAGYEDTMADHGLRPAARSYLCPPSIEGTIRLLTGLAEAGVSFDACIATDDELGIGAVKYALRNGLRPGEDFQVCGFNNSLLASCCQPELTSVDNRSEYMCVTAVGQLMQVLDKKEVAESTLFHAQIIHRGTTRQDRA